MSKTILILQIILYAIWNLTPAQEPVTIDRPVFDGAVFVTGSATPGDEMSLVVVGDVEIQATAVDATGRYVFQLTGPLNVNDMVTVWSKDGADSVTARQAASWLCLPIAARGEK